MNVKNNKGKVVIRFGYGLGSQMFYYALYKSLQSKGINVYFDDWFFRKRTKKKHETYKLDYFGILQVDLKFLKFEDYKELIDIGFWSLKGENYNSKLKLIGPKYLKKIIIMTYNLFKLDYKIKDSYYIEKVVKKPIPNITENTRVYLQGILQSYKYFEDIREILLKDFSFKKELPLKIKRILSDIQNCNSIAIHVRRGDFIGEKDLDVSTLVYYKNAINLIKEKQENPCFFIFSNDPKYVKSNFTFLKEYYLIENTEDRYADYYDLLLMTQAKHNIIPNSSFAWWGAWLNQNYNKMIIVPEIWRGTNKYFADPEFIYPKEWIRLPVN